MAGGRLLTGPQIAKDVSLFVGRKNEVYVSDGKMYVHDGVTMGGQLLADVDQLGGGGGAVDSVNGQTGAVVLDAADVGAVAADQAIVIIDGVGSPLQDPDAETSAQLRIQDYAVDPGGAQNAWQLRLTAGSDWGINGMGAYSTGDGGVTWQQEDLSFYGNIIRFNSKDAVNDDVGYFSIGPGGFDLESYKPSSPGSPTQISWLGVDANTFTYTGKIMVYRIETADPDLVDTGYAQGAVFNTTEHRFKVIDPDTQTWKALVSFEDLTLHGATGARPSLPSGLYPTGTPYFDTSLGANGKPIWVDKTGSGWVDATGAAV